MMSRLASFALLAVPLFVLSGCGDGDVQEVKQWMNETRAKSRVVVPKLAEPKTFTPFVYAVTNEVDPFNSQKLSVALAKQQAVSNNGLKPDFTRRKEALEAYPLDTIVMVGTLQKPGVNYALLRADKTLYQAKAGNYIGQNFGRITKVTESEVELSEIVRDAAGEWVERKAKLELQESKK